MEMRPLPERLTNRTNVAGASSAKKNSKGGNRWKKLNSFFDTHIQLIQKEVTASYCLVWLCIFRHEMKGKSRLSQARIARDLGCNVRTVGRAVKWLKENGYLVVLEQGGLCKGMSVYQVSFPP